MHPFCFRLRLMGMNDENNASYDDQPLRHSALERDETDDLTLVIAARAGNTDAFAMLVERHTERIYGLAVRLPTSTDEAEDATQEAVIRAYYHLDTFRGTATFATWLYRIALNICRDQLRRRQVREQHTEVRRVNHLWADEHYSVDPERVAMALEDRQMLDRALAQLPTSYRATLLLHDVDGLTISEVAVLMDTPLPTAKSRLRRARMVLVTLLEESTLQPRLAKIEHTPSHHRGWLEKGGTQ